MRVWQRDRDRKSDEGLLQVGMSFISKHISEETMGAGPSGSEWTLERGPRGPRTGIDAVIGR